MTSKAVEMVDGIISFRSYAFKAKIVRYTIEIIFVAIDMIQDEYRVYLLTLFPKQQGHRLPLSWNHRDQFQQRLRSSCVPFLFSNNKHTH